MVASICAEIPAHLSTFSNWFLMPQKSGKCCLKLHIPWVSTLENTPILSHTYSCIFFQVVCGACCFLYYSHLSPIIYRSWSHRNRIEPTSSVEAARFASGHENIGFSNSVPNGSLSDRAKTMSAEANKTAEVSENALEDLPSSKCL